MYREGQEGCCGRLCAGGSGSSGQWHTEAVAKVGTTANHHTLNQALAVVEAAITHKIPACGQCTRGARTGAVYRPVLSLSPEPKLWAMQALGPQTSKKGWDGCSAVPASSARGGF